MVKFVRPNHLIDTISHLKSGMTVLDVGCGSNSPVKLKSFFPNLTIHGIDIYDVGNHAKNALSEFYLSSSDSFDTDINSIIDLFDCVISHHNLEHCIHRDLVLASMCKKLKPEGLLFLCFPSLQSPNLPSRKGTLNYFDDTTHVSPPIDSQDLIIKLVNNKMEILFFASTYKPVIMRHIGRILEPISKRAGKVLPGTWSYYGFETVLVAQKK